MAKIFQRAREIASRLLLAGTFLSSGCQLDSPAGPNEASEVKQLQTNIKALRENKNRLETHLINAEGTLKNRLGEQNAKIFRLYTAVKKDGKDYVQDLNHPEVSLLVSKLNNPQKIIAYKSQDEKVESSFEIRYAIPTEMSFQVRDIDSNDKQDLLLYYRSRYYRIIEIKDDKEKTHLVLCPFEFKEEYLSDDKEVFRYSSKEKIEADNNSDPSKKITEYQILTAKLYETMTQFYDNASKSAPAKTSDNQPPTSLPPQSPPATATAGDISNSQPAPASAQSPAATSKTPDNPSQDDGSDKGGR